MSYDDNNIFAKILRGEIPCNKIYEDNFVLSFHDINPQKKIHALIIPKGKYIDLDDFSTKASPDDHDQLHNSTGTNAHMNAHAPRVMMPCLAARGHAHHDAHANAHARNRLCL